MLGTREKTKVATNNNTTVRTSPTRDGANCVVSTGTKIEGNFRSTENTRLDGEIIGEFRCDKKVVMGDKSRIQGKLIATDALIMGTVDGEVMISGTLHLQATAVINGDISAKAITVEEGAQYNGNCKIGASVKQAVTA